MPSLWRYYSEGLKKGGDKTPVKLYYQEGGKKMKYKITLLSALILIMLVPCKSYGEEYTPWTESFDPTYKEYEMEYRYKWYKSQKVGRHFDVGENHTGYPYTDGKKLILKGFSKWQAPCTTIDPNKNLIEWKNTYAYSRVEDVEYITISYTSYDIDFEEIKILYDEKETNFTIRKCPSCTNGNISLRKNDKIIINFGKPLDISKLSFHFKTSSESEKHYYITLSTDKDAKRICARKQLTTSMHDYTPDKSWLTRTTRTPYQPSDTEVTPTDFVFNNGKMDFCRYVPYSVYWYRINKVYYSNLYYKDSPTDDADYIKDEENYKVYYRYKISSKIEEIEDKDKEYEKDKEYDKDKEDEKETKEDNQDSSILNALKIPSYTEPELITLKNTQSNLEASKLTETTYIFLIIVFTSLIIVAITSKIVERKLSK